MTKLVVRGDLVYLNISSGSLWVQERLTFAVFHFDEFFLDKLAKVTLPI